MMQAIIQSPEHDPIEEFVRYYNNSGYLAYEKLGDRAKQILVSELEKQDIKHEILDRGKEGSAGGKAKAPASARQTALRRQRSRGKQYENMEEIIADMHDLAGLRIALYYPNDFVKVEEIIKNRMVEVKATQDWPDEQFGPFGYPTLDQGSSVGRKSRFPGYFARHFRIQLLEEDVSEPAIRGKTLEIQLMTVLMHAWSKMYQELVYKPRPGVPQADEDDERLLDISNGIIIAGEQVLRQIQINLDKKKVLGRRPFKNKHDLWNYVMESWLADKNNTLSPAQRLWVKERGEGAYTYGTTLYEALARVGFNNPEKLDILINKSVDSEFGPGGLQKPGVDFIEAMIIHLVAQEDFRNQEQGLFCLTSADDREPSLWVVARKARYQALIICSALRQRKPNSLGGLWESEFFNNIPAPYPSGQDLMRFLNPESTLNKTAGLNLGVIVNISRFCNYLMEYEDSSWKLQCALARVGYFHDAYLDDSLADGEDDIYKHGLTACPYGLIALLDYSAAHDGTPLGQSFQLLEAADRDGFAGFEIAEKAYISPAGLQSYRCPSLVCVAGSATMGSSGPWFIFSLDKERGGRTVWIVVR